MGIQGLLPLLKPITRHRHLSELSGQTLAVDGYVWLHRGAYACAAELAQGKPTRRYVDFCMARVRLLRHNGIVPYLVFDGGPLPAKLGTENERGKKREENLERANELMAKGKETQAREFFVKCVDVTPQMAYQVIKALKSDNISYVVAPYEADAQLAYLERMGIVDGILTEDSDLLVFGCRNVYFKLDTVSETVTHVPRKDFGSPALCVESFSLIGWSDTQFRRMAMLSGCDYLPSIPGVGLKTAHQLLKKHKTVDKAVKMLRLEGKKRIPDGYMEAFELAEKVFLHQRVFDPLGRRITFLAEPAESLGQEADKYIGQMINSDLAVKIAEGSACPISLEPMKDINPKFMPGISKLPLRDRNSKATQLTTPKAIKTGGILSFFTPVPRSASPPKQSVARPKHAKPGNASGKRTLVEVMEEDIAVKRKRIAEIDRTPSTSKFFAAEESILGRSTDKENIPVARDTNTDGEEIWDPVTQEEGYISPSPSSSRHLTPELSSPLLHRTSSMPVRGGSLTQEFVTQDLVSHILVRGSSEPVPDKDDLRGLDLSLAFGDEDYDDEIDDHAEASSEIAAWDDEIEPNPGLDAALPDDDDDTLTPPSSIENTQQNCTVEICNDYSSVHARLAQKWKASFSLQSPFSLSQGAQKLDEDVLTSMVAPETPHTMQMHAERNLVIQSASPAARRERTRTKPRASDPYPAQCGMVANAAGRSSAAVSRADAGAGTRAAPITIDDDLDEVEDEMMITTSARGRLQSFRFSR